MVSGVRCEVALMRCAIDMTRVSADSSPSARVSVEDSRGKADAFVVASGCCVVELVVGLVVGEVLGDHCTRLVPSLLR